MWTELVRSGVRPYLHYARCAFQRRAAYRLANWSGIAVNFFFFMIHAQVFLAFFGQRETVGGWRPQEAVLYFAASESLMMVLAAFPDWSNNLSVRIRTGEVMSDLARPVDLFWRDLGERFGNALYFLLTRTTVLYAAALLLYGIAPPLRIELLLFPVSLALAIAVSGAFWYIANATAFWSENALGSLTAMTWVHTILGGVVIPLDFYPPALQLVSNALPFRAALYTPVALVIGKLQGGALVFGLAHQVVWLALLIAMARAVEARGVRRLVAHGG